MDNQTNSVNKIICRKCGGPHFTIKCGKTTVPEPTVVPVVASAPNIVEHTVDTLSSKETKSSAKSTLDKKSEERSERFERPERRQYFKQTYRVKLGDLPVDMSEQEMMELTSDWGHVAKIRVINYEDASVSYIDFGYEDEADYFVKALDRTPFDHYIITAQRVESI